MIPIVLNYANEGNPELYSVLEEITGEDPVQRHHIGRYDNIRDDWLAWGRERGYIN